MKHLGLFKQDNQQKPAGTVVHPPGVKDGGVRSDSGNAQGIGVHRRGLRPRGRPAHFVSTKLFRQTVN